MRLLCSLILFATAFASPLLFAKKDGEVADGPVEVCRKYLASPQYGVSQVFGNRDPIWSLKAEEGSIETLQRGTVAELYVIRSEFRSSVFPGGNRFSGMSQVVQALDRVTRRLVDLRIRKPERRLNENIDHVLNYISNLERNLGAEPISKTTRLMTATLWELTISCFFNGDEIHLGQRVSELFPREYERDKGTQRNGWDREIDVAIENKDGSWRWIEVKDWGQNETMNDTGKATFMVQGRGQNQARRMLNGKKVELLLVLKYGIPAPQMEFYRRSHYDSVFLAFPAGPYTNVQ
jgi:hypothetical protein